MTAPNVLFADLDNEVERAKRFDAFKEALNKSADERKARANAGQTFDYAKAAWSESTVVNPGAALAVLEKTVSPEVLASLRAEIDKIGQTSIDLGKDISLTSPIASGLVPYDLEAPAKLLFPVVTPVRNGTQRVKGQGQTRRIKQITAISNSGTGAARLSPFMADNTTDSFGGLTLQRPKKISYVGVDAVFNYKQQGLSDSVTWSAEFAGLGFQDARQLSQTSILFASMLADELGMIGGRGTDAGYLGAAVAPTFANFTVTVRTAGAGETGNSANIANVYLKTTFEGIFGESPSSTTAANTGLSAATGKVLDITYTGTVPTGVTGIRYYLSIDNTTWYLYGRSAIYGGTSALGSAAFTFNFTGGGTGGAIVAGTSITTVATDSISSANAYDGLLTVQLDPARSGAILNVNPVGAAAVGFSTSNPGVEFQNLFAALYAGGIANVTGVVAGGAGNKANPDTAWLAGVDRKQLSDTIKNGASTNPAFYFAASVGNQANVALGGMVSAIYNEITGKIVNFKVHPWFNQGTALVMSEQLEIPNSEVSNTYYYALPQDYMAINWPVIATTYDVSSYWYGALIHAAPMFSGAITGIKAG